MQVICSEYLNLDQCNSKFDAAAWGDLKAVMASNDPNMAKSHKYKTVVPIIIKMMKEAKK